MTDLLTAFRGGAADGLAGGRLKHPGRPRGGGPSQRRGARRVLDSDDDFTQPSHFQRMACSMGLSLNGIHPTSRGDKAVHPRIHTHPRTQSIPT